MKRRLLIVALLLLAAVQLPAQVVCVGTSCSYGITPAYGGQVLVSTDVTVTRAEVQSLVTTEKTIVAGEAGYTLLPRLSIIKKAAGAYTVVGVTQIRIDPGTVVDNFVGCPVSSPGFGFLVAAGASTDMGCALLHNGFTAGLPFGVIGTVTVLDGKKLALRTTGASPAGSGGDLTVRLVYEKIPSQNFVLP